MTGTEIWRPIVGFEGKYEVSDYGRVRSCDRVQLWRRTILGKFIEGDRLLRGRMLKPTPKESGHLHVQLGRDHRVYVHQLVLEAFVGPPPAGMECLHWDDNPANNTLENLRWGTRAENLADFRRNYGHHQHHASRA